VRRAALAASLLWAGCAPEPMTLRAEPALGGLELRASVGVTRAEVLDEAGAVLAAASWPEPVVQAYVPAALPPGQRVLVRVSGGAQLVEQRVTVPAARGELVEAWLEVPAGQQRRALAPEVPVALVDGAAVRAQLWLAVRPGGQVTVTVAGEERVVRGDALGGRQAIDLDVGRDGAELVVAGEAVRLVPRVVSLAEAQRQLAVVDVRFPASASGRADRARPADALRLPARWWRRALWGAGLGYRPRDDQAPWAWEAVTLENRSEADQSVVVSERIVDDAGQPAHALRPRVRELDGQSDEVAVVLRVPAGERATAALPVYVDGAGIDDDALVWRQIAVRPLGSDTALHELRRPLALARGSWLASAGFALVVGLSAVGLGGLAAFGRRWMAASRTSDLVTIALFGALSFVTNTTTRVLGYGVEALLGPFAPLLTGLVDDTLRACLLGALVTLLPRPGVAALFSVLGYLLRGLALGSFHPTDLLYVGSVVATLELGLWLAGLTRGGAWRDGSRFSRWLRLSVAIGGANVVSAAAGYLSSIVLYRLFLADWYLALMLVFPGFLYVVFGCWLAVDFADALRRVQA